jgi:hypothetical protein
MKGIKMQQDAIRKATEDQVNRETKKMEEYTFKP